MVRAKRRGKQAEVSAWVRRGMEDRMGVRIGERAPDFKAEAWHQGSVQEVTLSQYLGQWVVLIFYPGDFTFV